MCFDGRTSSLVARSFGRRSYCFSARNFLRHPLKSNCRSDLEHTITRPCHDHRSQLPRIHENKKDWFRLPGGVAAWPTAVIVLLDHDCRLHHGHRYLFHVWNGVGLGHFDRVRSRYRNFDRDRNWPLHWDWNVSGHFDRVRFRDGNGDGAIDRDGDRYLKRKIGLINFVRREQ